MVRPGLRGIRVRVTPGWLITYLLLVMTLVLWRELPAETLGPDVARLAAVLLVPLLLFPTLLLHELAHVVVARRQGVRVHEVDLRMVGMSRGHASALGGASGEAAIALAGPLVSLGLGVGSLAVTFVLEGAAGMPLLGWTIGCVAIANLVVGLASLYPGYPMDGSDVVHAIAWRVTGSRQRAGQAVVRVGVLAGWCVMLTGVGVALRVDATGGMWLTLLGWALGRISRNARDHDRLTELVTGLTVADATQRDVAVVSPGLTLDTVVAQDRLTDGPGMFPVVRGGSLVGVIDVRDVGRAGRSGTDLRVADRMRAIDRVHVVTEGQRLWDAVAILERHRVNAVPVVAPDDRARLLGLVTRATVQRLLRARADAVAPTDAPTEPPDDASGEGPRP
jgi:CBS domain-containing protein